MESFPHREQRIEIKGDAEYKRLRKALISNEWSIDTSELERGFLRISREDLSYILYLFYGCGYPSLYIATDVASCDREEGAQNPPIWVTRGEDPFTSPVHLVEEYGAQIEAHYRSEGIIHNAIYKVVVMMPGNSILNSEELCAALDWVSVISYKNLISQIESGSVISSSSSPEEIS